MQVTRKTAPLLGLATLAALGLAAVPAAHAQTIVNSSFETPSVGNGGISSNPSGAGWTFTGSSGVTGNNSGFTSGNANAPDGVQVAFLQSYSGPGYPAGSFSQSISGFSAGTYTFSFLSSQRENYGTASNQTVNVTVDGNSVGLFTPSPALTTYQSFITIPTFLTAGSHTLQFAGTVPANSGIDSTAFVDEVTVSAVPEPSSVAAFGFTGLGVAGLLLRARKRRV
jgi:hypothetical protein